MSQYTVIMITPDYQSEQYGESFYFAWTEAENYESAVKAAQIEARDEQGSADDEPEDWAVVVVFPGHLTEIFS
jgi:hypothetical protein